MSVEGGSIGIAGGAGIEGGLAARFGPVMGPVDIGPIVNEGPVGFADMKNTMPLQIGSQPVEVINFQKPAEVLDAQAAVAEVESFLAQARAEPRQTVRPTAVIMPQVEPMLIPNELKDPVPQIIVSPALELAVCVQPALPDRQAGQAVATQPALQEEEVKKIVEEKAQQEPEEVFEEEETEESRLKDVVDEEVLNIRLEEFGMAADLVGAEVKEEIDGKKIVKYIPAETEANRSGLIKKRGPDGSREETIGEIASRKFRSIREAKEQIAAIITQKVPVKRAKEGIVVGYEAVARVLKYFFVKAKPAEQQVTRVIKKQRPVSIMSSVRPEVKEPRIEDLGLAEVFPKAA